MTNEDYFTNDIDVHSLENTLRKKYKKMIIEKGDSREDIKHKRTRSKQTE